jgi:hypothetical protein
MYFTNEKGVLEFSNFCKVENICIYQCVYYEFRVNEERNVLHTIKRRKANWIGHILHRNCLLKHMIEGKLEGRIEMTGKRGRRRKHYWMTLKKREDTGN